MRLDTHRLRTLDQVREFLARERGARPATATPRRRLRVRGQTLQRFGYALRGKTDEDLLRCFLVKATGLSRAQVTRLLRQHRTTGGITDRHGAPNRPFARRYTRADIGLPAETDALHGKLSGPATRALHLFGDGCERLARFYNGHLYNLRHSTTCARCRGAIPQPTRPVRVAIGERRRPQPFGRPGWVELPRFRGHLSCWEEEVSAMPK